MEMTADECAAEILSRYMDGLISRREAAYQLEDYCDMDPSVADKTLRDAEGV